MQGWQRMGTSSVTQFSVGGKRWGGEQDGSGADTYRVQGPLVKLLGRLGSVDRVDGETSRPIQS